MALRPSPILYDFSDLDFNMSKDLLLFSLHNYILAFSKTRMFSFHAVGTVHARENY